MPGIFTHYISGEKVLEKITDKDTLEIINKDRRIFDFGLQGPDFFKYYGAPFKTDDGINRLYMMLHERTIGEWFSTIYRYIKAQAPEDAAILKPYFLGYYVHYMVDCALNPYISYRVGFATPNADLTERFTVYRNKFVTAMDELILKHYKNKTPQEMEIDKIFWVEYKELLEITRMYPLHLKRILGREVSREQVIKAAQDMNRMSKKRIKPGFMSISVPVYELFNKEVYKGTYSSTRYGKMDPSIHYLNEQHTAWTLPWDNRKSSEADVIQMYEEAIEKAAPVVEQIVKGFNGEGSDIQLLELIGNNSMMTGVAWNAPFLPRHFDCVFKKDEEKIAGKLAKIQAERLKNE